MSEWKELLARKIAKDIFDCGADPGPRGRPHRIQFMGGEYQDEFGMGGLCEEALVQQIKKSLQEIKSE